MSDEIRLSATTVNAPDALALAIFYAELTGGDTLGSEHWATVSGPNGFIETFSRYGVSTTWFRACENAASRPPSPSYSPINAAKGPHAAVIVSSVSRGAQPNVA